MSKSEKFLLKLIIIIVDELWHKENITNRRIKAIIRDFKE